MGSPALAGPAKQCFSLPTTPSTAALALRGAGAAAARGRVNLGPARAQGPPGRQAFKKAEGKTNVLRNPFKKDSYTSVCAWRDVRETRAYIPSRPPGGGFFPATCARTGGERGRVPALRPGAGALPGSPARLRLCPRKPAPSLWPACAGSTDVQLVCKKDTKTTRIEKFW